ncbi:MAG: hypothetical protein ACX94C_09755 [Phycisphaerales bacterium]
MYKRDGFDQLLGSETFDTWKDVPTQLVLYDGQKNLTTSYSADPLMIVDENQLPSKPTVGHAIHLKACIWPILPVIAARSEWSDGDDGQFVLHDKQLSISLTFDAQGRLHHIGMVSDQGNSSLHASWAFSGYDKSGSGRYPASLTRSLHVLNKDQPQIDQVDEFALEFRTSPDEFQRLISLEDLMGSMERRNPINGDVSQANGDLLYNEKEELAKYYSAVGIKNPTHMRNLLFAVIGVLGLGSIVIIWKKKSA